MAGRERGWSWWQWGCAGCGALAVLLLLAASAAFWLARDQAAGAKPESRTLQPDLPHAPAAGEASSPPPAIPGREEPPVEIPPGAGRVVLDFSGAEFRIEPAADGEPLRIEATYDVQSYELQEQVETGEDVAWVYRASFRRKGAGAFLVGLKELLFGGRPEVRVLLPRDVPLDLRMKLERGGTEMEVGGLWLRSADLEFREGGLALSVREPLRQPMESLSIRGSMGGFAAARLGDASPERLDIDVRMGGMSVDLRGAWRGDSEVTVRFRMGGCALRLPRDAAIEGLGPEHSRPQPGGEERLPTLRFTPETTTKDLEIID